ncbi:MAG: hypothetical protein WCX31_14935 [Salinivirgaceae bacterium]
MGTKRKNIDLKPGTEKNLKLEDEVLIALTNTPEANEYLSNSEKMTFINSFIIDVKNEPLQFVDGFSAESVRNLNRRIRI